MPMKVTEYVSNVWRKDMFADKVVFCTGGNGTICSAQVRAIVHLGANACIVGRNIEKTRAVAEDIATCREGAKVIGLGNVDVRKADRLSLAAQQCAEELGGIDFVIAGAAGNFLAPIMDLSSNAFKSVIDIDVLGSYNTVKATLPYLLKSAAAHRTNGTDPAPGGTGGRIIFISATVQYTGLPLQAHLSAAKAAVDSLSNTLSIEMGPRGMTSNVIAPGAIAGTEGLSRLVKLRNAASERALKTIPSGRLGSVRETADAAVYLFSDAANYINGHIIVVDGGAWRMGQGLAGPGSGFEYPDFLLDGNTASDVKGQNKTDTKL